MKRKTNLSY